MTGDPILTVERLTLSFPGQYGGTELLRDVSLSLNPGETVGVVGESGSGKTLLGLSMLALEPKTAVVGGTVAYDGRDLHAIDAGAQRSLRGSEIAMIYQDALVSLNPGMKVKAQLKQALGNAPEQTCEDLLQAVQLDDVNRFMEAYPHQLSGGQRQRVLIAMAIARRPRVIVADEPTTALDVTVQAGIMRLLRRLRDELRFALVLISHDLGLVAGASDRVAVMYAGDLVELGPTADVLARSAHPYTAGLIEASRSLEEGRTRLAQIGGVVPAPADFSDACRFADRCPRAGDPCREQRPPLGAPAGEERTVLCHFPIVATVPVSEPDPGRTAGAATAAAPEHDAREARR